jgi:hypothetical protein
MDNICSMHGRRIIYVNLIEIAQNTIQLQVFVKTAMKFRFVELNIYMQLKKTLYYRLT